VPDRAALHGDDRVVSVAALRGRGQSGDRTCRDIAQQAFDREGGYVMALVDDDVAVAGKLDVLAAGERLDHRDVDAA
jgi:hypothetical protein